MDTNRLCYQLFKSVSAIFGILIMSHAGTQSKICNSSDRVCIYLLTLFYTVQLSIDQRLITHCIDYTLTSLHPSNKDVFCTSSCRSQLHQSSSNYIAVWCRTHYLCHVIYPCKIYWPYNTQSILLIKHWPYSTRCQKQYVCKIFQIKYLYFLYQGVFLKRSSCVTITKRLVH